MTYRILREFDILLLQLIAEEPSHGYALARRIEQQSGQLCGHSSIYYSLGKLAAHGLILQEAWESKKNPQRKHSSITKKGLRLLRSQRAQWLKSTEDRHEKARQELARLQWILASMLGITPRIYSPQT
jgi:PadR family transcriptional regulator PadR